MKWRTEVEIVQGSDPIGYQDEVLVLGSCFADHLGEKLAHYQFRHLANPFGILFHPIPLGHLVKRAVEG
ncbi:GSCFA domain-containing protein, partial [Robiginitalea sp.]|uniref:GSCFA domain-containing protein n=1 Tax=Robiginitalea sp. TaxID=1902411 RepID=UPI003C76EDFF